MLKPINNLSAVLYIGPQYENHRGGIGAVLSIYAKNVNTFKFIASYDGARSSIQNAVLFIVAIVRLFWTLTMDRDIRFVHIHGASKGSFYRKYIVYFISKYVFSKKVIFHLHGGGFQNFYSKSNKLIKRAIQDLLRGSSAVICLSKSWYQYLSSSFRISSLFIINNPVEPAENSCSINPEEGEKIRLLFLGLISENKGIFDLIDVLADNKEMFGGRLLLSIGGNGEIDRLNKLIKEKQLEDVVEYVGWIDGVKKSHLLNNCDALILPSYVEGVPMSILEAMSYKKAIISTKVGGIPEIVEHGKNGFLISPGDKKALTEHLFNILDDYSLTRKMGLESFEKVRPYLVSNVIKQLEDVYKNQRGKSA